MSYFTVTREARPGWVKDEGIAHQPGLEDHAEFMNLLAEQGFVLFGGPLSGTEEGRLRALLVIDSSSEAEIERCLADDPWTLSDRLRTVNIEPWKIFVGADRLSSVAG